jgi:hypothetical protein
MSLPRRCPLRSTLLIVLVLAVLAAPPALAGRADSEYDADFDFSTFQTFDWLPVTAAFPPGHPLAPGGDVDRQIRAAVEKRLVAKGFRPAREGGADFLLHYDAFIQEHLQSQGDPEPFVHGGGLRVTFSWKEGEQAQAYSEGSLVIEVIDPASREAVWVGWATSVAEDTDKLRSRIDKSVQRILKRFPPKG